MGGQPYTESGQFVAGEAKSATGAILCECGWASPILHSSTERWAAHAIHKSQVRALLREGPPGIVGRCWWCHEVFLDERSMTDHYDAIRAGQGCHLPEVQFRG